MIQKIIRLFLRFSPLQNGCQKIVHNPHNNPTSKFEISKYKKIKNFFLVHESNLPIGRGWSPVKYQLLANKSKIKCCLISCEDPIDSGDIYETGTLNIDKTDLYDDIKIKQYKVTINLITRLIKKYPNIKSKKQKGKVTWYKKLSSEDDKLDINQSISSQFNKIRSTDHHNYQNYFYTLLGIGRSHIYRLCPHMESLHKNMKRLDQMLYSLS